MALILLPLRRVILVGVVSAGKNVLGLIGASMFI